MKCTVNLSKYMYVVKCSVWVCGVIILLLKYWGQQWKQGKRCLIKSGTPFLRFANPFFSRESVECEARQKLLIREEQRSLYQHDVRNGTQQLQQLGQSMRHKTKNFGFHHPQLSAQTSAFLIFFHLTMPLPWPDKSKCGLGSKPAVKKKK